jgi:hypothetical protein
MDSKAGYRVVPTGGLTKTLVNPETTRGGNDIDLNYVYMRCDHLIRKDSDMFPENKYNNKDVVIR